MKLSVLLRSPRVLLCLVLIGILWPTSGAAAQDDATTDDAVAAKACAFTKVEAVEANGEPLGQAIWGRLCQLIDGEAKYAGGVTVQVSQAGEIVGEGITDDGGVFVVPISGNGVYEVSVDTETFPDGFSLANSDLSTLSGVSVTFGDQQAIFRLGEDTRVQRDFSAYATTVAKGIRFGLILAVAAVGLSMVYGVTGLVNFAHAELVTIGALVALALDRSGVPFWLGVPVAVVVGALLGAANDVAVWRPLRRRRMALLSMMVVSIGLSTAVRNLLQIQSGVTGRRYSASSGQRDSAYGPFRLAPNDIRIIVLCIVVLAAMTILLRRTRLGTAIRAVADNPDLAASSGIAVNRIVTLVWAICGGLAAFGGILYGLTVTVRFDTGFVLLLSMFAAVVLGGLGNAYGAIFGAVVIGVVQETSGLFIDTDYKFVTAMIVLIFVLLVRPQGILGQKERLG